MSEEKHPIILFDGVCNLCNSTVDFVISRDQEKEFRFAPLQSEKAQQLIQGREIDAGDMDTLVLIEGKDTYLKSDAYIRILDEVGGFWRVVSLLLRVVPAPLRDFLYDLVSKLRYRIFGKKNKCMVPDEDVRDRFLSEES
ncbi:MAG: thiol-disulfide oxidoreductase DCC family protein [Candidatus Nanohaloarchaea archaeon]